MSELQFISAMGLGWLACMFVGWVFERAERKNEGE